MTRTNLVTSWWRRWAGRKEKDLGPIRYIVKKSGALKNMISKHRKVLELSISWIWLQKLKIYSFTISGWDSNPCQSEAKGQSERGELSKLLKIFSLENWILNVSNSKRLALKGTMTHGWHTRMTFRLVWPWWPQGPCCQMNFRLVKEILLATTF